MISRVQNEIIELHQFFQDWYNNQLSKTEENFSRFADVLSPDFTIIFPSGDTVQCQPLLEKLWMAHQSQKDMRIWIENISVRHQFSDVILATYEEWQQKSETETARLSSVLFKKLPDTPNGLAWLHVHETWIKS